MKHLILSRGTQFACFTEFQRFRGVLWNSALAGDKRTNMAYFGWVQVAVDN